MAQAYTAAPVLGQGTDTDRKSTEACWPTSLVENYQALASVRDPVTWTRGREVQRRVPDILFWPPHTSPEIHPIPHLIWKWLPATLGDTFGFVDLIVFIV